MRSKGTFWKSGANFVTALTLGSLFLSACSSDDSYVPKTNSPKTKSELRRLATYPKDANGCFILDNGERSCPPDPATRPITRQAVNASGEVVVQVDWERTIWKKCNKDGVYIFQRQDREYEIQCYTYKREIEE